MRYLLLSVLVVCVIGVMIPNAFAAEPVATNNVNFFKIYQDPDKYKGVWVRLSGEVTNIQYYESGNTGLGFKVGGVDNISGSNAWIVDHSNSKFSKDQCLFVEGSIAGSTELTSTVFGNKRSWDVPLLRLQNYQETDRESDDVSPYQ